MSSSYRAGGAALILMAATGFTIPAAHAGETLQVSLQHGPSADSLALINASCVAAGPDAAAPGANHSPAVRWSAGPHGTRSYAVIMEDPDVPADLSQLNKTGTVIAADAPRMTFVHWLLVDIPTGRHHLPEGADGKGLAAGGLPLTATALGRRGQNGFAAFFKDGPYGGYRGPCPPWNDRRVHRYRLTVYALDTAHLAADPVTASTFAQAVHGHILAQGTAEASYAINPEATRATP